MGADLQTPSPKTRKPLRLWPGVAAGSVILGLRFVGPALVRNDWIAPLGMLGGLAGSVAVWVWWLFWSWAPWSERLVTFGQAVAVLFAAIRLLHPSIAGGMMGLLFFFYAIPSVAVALVAAVGLSRRSPPWLRRVWVGAGLLLSAAAWDLVRTDGITGAASSEFAWRWSKTAEERLLAAPGPQPRPRPAAAAATGGLAPEATPPAEWPGFRGSARDGVVRGVAIETDWSASGPTVLWWRPVGPGWSSFAVAGGMFFTQEQRGEAEVVSCHRLTTGEPVWRHADPARFWESNGGAGPRATPSLGGGRVYTLGATGILNALDASTGAVAWSRNAARDAGVKTPGWGFSGSPLLTGDLVVVSVAGKLAGYATNDGRPRWNWGAGGVSYSSPHLATNSDTPQIVFLATNGPVGILPATGAQLWDYAWEGVSIVQPRPLPDGDILVTTGGPMGGLGIRRLSIAHEPGGWRATARWESTGLKPYFNDYVVHQEHAYGFDGSLLACVSLGDGARRWKDGRYGNGQLLVLEDQGVLLVVAETGELVLVEAAPTSFKELARAPGIRGKTWNHPALVGDVLLVRNAEEMAAFKLPRRTREQTHRAGGE